MTASLWGPERRTLTAGLVLTTTIVASESLAIATIMPLVSRDLSGLALYGWAFSGFFLGILLGIAVAGRQIDRYGIARPFALGLALFAAGLALCGLAPSMPLLVAGRVLQGIGAGYEPPASFVAIGRAYPDAARPRMFFWLSLAWVAPGIAGPGIAAAVAASFGWRAVFLGLLPFAVVVGLVTLGALATTDRMRAVSTNDRTLAPSASGTADAGGPSRPGGGRLGSSTRLAAGAALAMAGAAAGSLLLGVPLVVAGVALGVPAFRRLTPEGTLAARRGLPAAILLRGVLTFAFFAVDAFVALLVVDVRGAEVALAGIAYTAATVTWTAGAWVQAQLVDRVGPRRLVATGFAVVAIGTAATVPVLSADVAVWFAVLASGISGLGMGLAYSPISLVMLREADPDAVGVVSSALSVSDVLGTALGTGVGGALVAGAVALGLGAPAGLAATFAMSIGMAIAGLMMTSRLGR